VDILASLMILNQNLGGEEPAMIREPVTIFDCNLSVADVKKFKRHKRFHPNSRLTNCLPNQSRC
jgi:hypothetical protein